MEIVHTFRRRSAIAVAIASVGIAALTGCTSDSQTPQQTQLSTKSAAAYYEATSCDLNAAEGAFSVALGNAEQSTESTGPDLENLKAAALSYQKASRAAVAHLGNSKIVWPTSVRKSMVVLTKELRAMISPLGEMAAGKQMTDEQAAFTDLPDNAGAKAALTVIHSKLGLPSDTSNSCPNSGPQPTKITVEPATGVLIAGTGYSFHAPAGWTLPKKAMKADSYAISATSDARGVYDTVNVLLGAPNGDTPNEEEQNGVQYLEQVEKATSVQVRPRILIAGEASIHISSLGSHHGVTQWDEQYLVNRGGTVFTVTFALNKSESQATREASAESVLASWIWT
jgi:hypothetical protein